jgi:hypothetical protein
MQPAELQGIHASARKPDGIERGQKTELPVPAGKPKPKPPREIA